MKYAPDTEHTRTELFSRYLECVVGSLLQHHGLGSIKSDAFIGIGAEMAARMVEETVRYGEKTDG